MFDSLSGTSVRWQSVDRAYVLGLYGGRLASAVERGEDGLDGLDRAVAQLRESTEPSFAFVFIARNGNGFFLWLDPELSKVIAYWRGVESRHAMEG